MNFLILYNRFLLKIFAEIKVFFATLPQDIGDKA